MCNLAPSFARHIGRTDEDGPRALDSCAGGAVVICFSGFLGDALPAGSKRRLQLRRSGL